MSDLREILRSLPLVRAANNQMNFYRGLRRGSFSQHGEDAYVLNAFGSRGVYVDVGANDPHRLSNTYALYRAGWRGLTIEPIRSLVDRHKKLRPHDKQVLAGVGVTDGVAASFHVLDPHVLSTFDEVTARAYIEAGLAKPLATYDVPIRRLSTLIDEAGFVDIDLLSVDVEGYELETLSGLDFERHRPRMIILEALSAVGENQKAGQVRELLAENRFEMVDRLGANEVYRPI